MSSTRPIPESEAARGPCVGVLGAGQLGRMLALAGYPLGSRFVFLDPAADAPASALGEHLVADYLDAAALARLAQCDVVTYEFESVPVAAAEELATRTRVYPPPSALRTAQDRLTEKEFFRSLEIPTPGFVAIDSAHALNVGVQELGLPAVLKTRRFGYDGKGQRVLRRPDDVTAAWNELGGAPLILEAFVPFQRELSILGVRGSDGATVFYPLVHNQHRDGILRASFAPAPLCTPELTARAERYSQLLLDRLGYVGVLALELFECDGELYANEMAPRVHNSGHFSIEGARTSQFENHLRAILDLPLGATEVPEPTAMLNLVDALPERAAVLRVPGTHLHFYAKTPRPGRKVGHITVTAPTVAELMLRVEQLRTLPGVG